MLVITTARPMTIGELAEAAGTSVTRVRFYERAGLLGCARRTPGGHRKYDQEQLQRLMFILRAREFGFGLEQIRMLLPLIGEDQASCRQVQRVAATRLADVRHKIAQLTELERALADAIEGCETDLASICPVLKLLNCSPSLQPGPSTAKVDCV